MYRDSEAAITELKDLQEELAQGLIKDGETVVKKIDFAVNQDIYEEVNQKARELGLSVNIRNLGATRDEIIGFLKEARENVVDHPLENFFGELFGSFGSAASLHAAINGFMVWKGAKEKSQAMEDTFYNSVISSSGLAAAHVTEFFILAEIEMIAGVLASPLGALALAPVAMYARGIFKRLDERRHVAKRFQDCNQRLESLILGFQG